MRSRHVIDNLMRAHGSQSLSITRFSGKMFKVKVLTVSEMEAVT